MGFVLASTSPRRRELLSMLGLGGFRVIPPDGEESPNGLPPAAAVKTIALEKAKSVARLCAAGEIVIAADTLVYLDSVPFGKPENPDDAARMLKSLSGRAHMVYTGVALVRDGVRVTGAEATRVFFRDMSGTEIDAYVKTGEPLDKAGAYGAQGIGAKFIERVEGDFWSVMGLPLCRLSLMLRELGVYL